MIQPHDKISKYTGRGVFLKIDNTEYLDCASGTFNLSLGYSQAEIVTALHHQLDRCAHLSSDYTKELSSTIFSALKPHVPPHIEAFWFRDIIGSTANECAIRMAQKATGKTDVISLFLSHHGQSVMTTGISGNSFRQKSFSLPNYGALKIPAPNCANCFYDKESSSCNQMCATRLEDFIAYASSGNVAALIIEPIMGNGGNIVPTQEYFKVMRAICDRHKILIIADEVQTCFGRTGEFFASNGYARDLQPDIITFAKGAGGIGIPAAGVLMRKELDVLDFYEHSTTSGANPLSLVAMQETIKYINNNDILTNVKNRGGELLEGLVQLSQEFPCIKNVKGMGLMLGFDVIDSTAMARFISLAKKNLLIVRGSRYGFGNTIKIRPPLIITPEEVRLILDRLRTTLNQFICEE